MALNLPPFGTDKYTLCTPKSGSDRRPRIERRIFVDSAPNSYWDEETKDFVTARGRWQVVETFGPFEDRDTATEFMRLRREAAKLEGLGAAGAQLGKDEVAQRSRQQAKELRQAADELVLNAGAA